MISLQREEIREIKKTRNGNFKIISLFSRFLNDCPNAIKPSLIDGLCEDGDDKESAYIAVLSYIFDLDEEGRDRGFVREYLVPSVKMLDSKREEYLSCTYRKILEGMRVSKGNWSIRSDKYSAYEAFPCGEMITKRNFAEHPQIGFFSEDFSFPAIYQDSVEWMSLKPNEIETMKEPIENAFGDVTVLGLGLGFYAFSVSEKESVRSVRIIEKDRDVISLFKENILPHIPHKEKISIIHADALEYMKNKENIGNTDYVFADIWHDTSDGLPLYLKIKKCEKNFPSVRFDYWIEKSILSRLRWILFDDYISQDENKILSPLPHISGKEELIRILDDSSLRILAREISISEEI